MKKFGDILKFYIFDLLFDYYDQDKDKDKDNCLFIKT